MAMIRYPGSKQKLVHAITEHMPQWSRFGSLFAEPLDYREPFFGAGALGFVIMERLDETSHVWINDADPGIAALWRSVKDRSKELMALIHHFEPSVEKFQAFKRHDGKEKDELLAGFQKLALHQMSVSGFGAMSGGPIGGRNQTEKTYQVGCRWSSPNLMKHVKGLSALLNKFERLRITCDDYRKVLVDLTPETFVYLDPPYVEKGPILYKHAMADEDHRQMAAVLRDLPCPWILSYDDHALVRELYGEWCRIEPICVTYSNAVISSDKGKKAKRPKNAEVVIYPTSNASQRAARATDGTVRPVGRPSLAGAGVKGGEKSVKLTDLPRPNRAAQNGVGYSTQRKLDKLARESPELHRQVCRGELSADAAYRELMGKPASVNVPLDPAAAVDKLCRVFDRKALTLIRDQIDSFLGANDDYELRTRYHDG